MRAYTIANILTTGRLLAIPLVIFLLFKSRKFPDYQMTVLIILICMQASDILDGYFARMDQKKNKTPNPFGQIMDPVADKLYINSTYIALVFTHNFPVWITAIILGKDILLTIGWTIRSFLKKNKGIFPNFWGKACDTCQAFFIFAFLFNLPKTFLNYCSALTISLTILSGIMYLRQDFLLFFANEK
jgi:cardiolipin synthase (CMP-forming)